MEPLDGPPVSSPDPAISDSVEQLASSSTHAVTDMPFGSSPVQTRTLHAPSTPVVLLTSDHRTASDHMMTDHMMTDHIASDHIASGRTQRLTALGFWPRVASLWSELGDEPLPSGGTANSMTT